MKLAFALTGGKEGHEMSRTAFAPLLKFASQTDDFINLVDELDQIEADLFDASPEEKITKRIEYIIENREESFAKVEA